MEAGKPFFENAHGNRTTVLPQVMLSKPIRRKVEVTGITGQGETRQVEFTWQWDLDGLPREVKETFSEENAIHKTSATLRLYGDGWRVSEWKM
jgi:hypothetical protein